MRELRVDRPTFVLSFDYERGLAFDSAELADRGLDLVLAALARRNLRGTFNCVARIVEVAPERIQAIAAAGHEVACHGYMHESPRDLTDLQLRQMLFRSRETFARLDISPIGFRSPRSHWDQRLPQELARLGFRYNAEHDKAHHPYLLAAEPKPVVRMPVTTDDWGYVKYPTEPDRVPSRHLRYLRRAAEQKLFLALGYHPWLLAEKPQRFAEFEALIDLAVNSGFRIGCFADVLDRVLPANDETGRKRPS